MELAEEQYELLKPFQKFWTTHIPTTRVLGLLAATLGMRKEAASNFEHILVRLRNAFPGRQMGWVCHDYASAIIQGNCEGDAQYVMNLLEESRTISNNLGMKLLLERVISLQARVGLPAKKVPAYPDGLTQREVEFLALVVAGKTDREIGEELVISIRTVTTHVSNILNKIGAANRTEAATYANRNGLA